MAECSAEMVKQWAEEERQRRAKRRRKKGWLKDWPVRKDYFDRLSGKPKNLPPGHYSGEGSRGMAKDPKNRIEGR